MDFEKIELAPTADFHVHLRDGEMMRMVVPTIRLGGVDTVYVMPNLIPPVTTVEAAKSYLARIQPLAPDVKFLMTLYMTESLTPEIIDDAASAGITGVKVYPAGVTTNSQSGVVDYESFFPIFEAMQRNDMVLNLHGEAPSTPSGNFIASEKAGESAVSVLNAEKLFLPTLHKIHNAFPKLRIVLEHCTTRDALDAVLKCGPSVAATITAHHLWICVDDVCGDAFNFCKPVAKTMEDRVALVRAAVEGGNGKFFFGSDSAPHPVTAKTGVKKAAAGCFTQSCATQLVIGAIEEAVAKGWISREVTAASLEDFLSNRGRKFYKLPEHAHGRKIQLERKGAKVPDVLKNATGDIEVIPFRRGEDTWKLTWK
ncbi:Dihydroorotase [Pseudovirgaria hyperparasitica]|uniref:Dihydroorotase n=1 Tax=Pseudovirgaria hyperparasitica TaxID=470096 RepID=A0A6A6W5M5_9PEZI|nr:Dihydroorotase [Pseudovirgaria hyperparasitica]KAF2758182.1 Dihydroorotase [Pseudovirgaria hyperparasitica]